MSQFLMRYFIPMDNNIFKQDMLCKGKKKKIDLLELSVTSSQLISHRGEKKIFSLT
jgi:hypothetical protein